MAITIGKRKVALRDQSGAQLKLDSSGVQSGALRIGAALGEAQDFLGKTANALRDERFRDIRRQHREILGQKGRELLQGKVQKKEKPYSMPADMVDFISKAGRISIEQAKIDGTTTSIAGDANELTKGLLSRKGLDATNALPEFSQELRAAYDKAVEGLTEDERLAVGEDFAAYKEQIMGQAMGHVRRENERYVQETYKKKVDSLIAISSIGNPLEIKHGDHSYKIFEGKAFSAIERMGATQGWSDETIQQNKIEVASKFTATIAYDLFNDNRLPDAEYFLESRKDVTDPKIMASLKAALAARKKKNKEDESLGRAYEARDEAVAEHGDNFGAVREAVGKKLKGDHDARKKAEMLVRNFRTDRQSEINIGRANASSRLTAVATRGAAVISNPHSSLDEKAAARRQFNTVVKQMGYTDGASQHRLWQIMSGSIEKINDTNSNRRASQLIAEFNSHPPSVIKYDLTKMLHDGAINFKDYKNLLSYQNDFIKSGGQPTFKEDFSRIKQYFDITNPKFNDSKNREGQKLRGHLLQWMKSFHQENGRRPTIEETKVMGNALQADTKRHWFGNDSIAELSPEEVTKMTFSEIPLAILDKAAELLRERGISSPTEEGLREMALAYILRLKGETLD